MWRALEQAHIDLIVLDLMLPAPMAWSCAAPCVQVPGIPVIMLDCKGDEWTAFWVWRWARRLPCQTFQRQELMARIKVVLRRVREIPRSAGGRTGKLAFSGWTLDTRTQHSLHRMALWCH